MRRVRIRGEGIAARCCEHLLRRAGCTVVAERSRRAGVPAIMLNAGAIAMTRDVLGQPLLFAGSHRIEKRVVAWGERAEPVTLDHFGLVLSERELLDAVASPESSAETECDWTVLATRPVLEACSEHHFGSRVAHALPVAIAGDSATCWIESLEDGWLFLIPNSNSTAWLLSVGASPEVLLPASRLIRPRIGSWDGAVTSFPAHPRIIQPLCGPNWLVCGSAAMIFDPICGDGTAHAVREAILAAAVIRAGSSALSHYSARLTAGFERHLALCLNFYQSGGSGAWWQSEAAALRQGLDWCRAQSLSFEPYRYQLQGFDLVPVLP